MATVQISEGRGRFTFLRYRLEPKGSKIGLDFSGFWEN